MYKHIGVSGVLQNFLWHTAIAHVESTFKCTHTYTSNATITIRTYTQCRERINNLENVHSSTIKMRQHFPQCHTRYSDRKQNFNHVHRQ